MRRLGVLTSGGDAPGMNAAIRAVTRAGIAAGHDVVGIHRGYAGLLEDDMGSLDRAAVVNIIQRGGTILGTARCDRFKTPEGIEQAGEVLAAHEIDGLVLIGGDGTFRGGSALTAAGGPACIGIPGTIDNDVFGTDRSLGFDSAVNTALDAIDRVRDTATSHEMLHFVEVMGRSSGWLAIASGLAGGAEAVFCPERRTNPDVIVQQLLDSVRGGKRSVLIVVAEGYGHGASELANSVGPRLGLDYRVTTLGHTQRGGSPTAIDRTLGGVLGLAAVDALLAGKSGLMVGLQGDQVVETELELTWSQPHPVPSSLLDLMQRLG